MLPISTVVSTVYCTWVLILVILRLIFTATENSSRENSNTVVCAGGNWYSKLTVVRTIVCQNTEYRKRWPSFWIPSDFSNDTKYKEICSHPIKLQYDWSNDSLMPYVVPYATWHSVTGWRTGTCHLHPYWLHKIWLNMWICPCHGRCYSPCCQKPLAIL